MTTLHNYSVFTVAMLSLMACADSPMPETTEIGPVEVGGAPSPQPSMMMMTGMPPVAGAGGSNAPAPTEPSTPPVSQGDVQSCVYTTGCLEFRMHPERCQPSNEANCKSLFGGTYAIGACDASKYPMMPMTTETSCGPTLQFGN
jgi:hypothetical protein